MSDRCVYMWAIQPSYLMGRIQYKLLKPAGATPIFVYLSDVL